MITSKPSRADVVRPSGVSAGIDAALTSIWRLAQRRGASALALYAYADNDLQLLATRGPSTAPRHLSSFVATNGHRRPRRVYVNGGPTGAPNWPDTLWLPLTNAEAPLGWLVLWTDTTTLRRRSSLLTLRALADGLAQAVWAAQLQMELEWRQTTYAILQRVSELIHSPLSLPHIFDNIVHELTTTGGYLYVAIYRREGDTLICEAQRGIPDQLAESSIPITRGIMGRAARTGQTQFVTEVTHDSDYIKLTPSVSSEIAVPIVVDGKVTAILNVESEMHHPLTRRDVQLLVAVAGQVGVALTNAQRYRESQRRLANPEALWAQTADLGGELDVRSLLGQTHERTAAPTDAHTTVAERERVRLLGLTNKLVDVLFLAQSLPNQFSSSDVAVIQAMADQLSDGMTAAQLFEAEQRKTRQLIAIHSINREVAAVLNRDELIDCVVARIRDHLGYAHICLYLLKGDVLQAVAGDNDCPPVVMGEGVVGITASTGLGYLTKRPGRMTVPMSIGQRVLGVLDVQSDPPGVFDEVDLVALGAIASQVAVALVNAENFMEAAQRAEELSTLYDAAQAVVGQLGLSEVAQTITNEARRLTGAEGALVMRLSADKSTRICLAVAGHLTGLQAGDSLPVGSGLAGGVAVTGEPVLANNLLTAPHLTLTAHACGVSALLVVPLKVQGQIIGELGVIQRTNGAGFDERDLRLLGIFAQQAALGIHNAQLYQAERGLTRQLDLANQIARLTTAALDVDEVLRTTTHTLTHDLGFFGATVMLFDPATDELVIRALSSQQDTPINELGYRFSPARGVSGLAFRTGETVISNDADNDPRIMTITPNSPVRSVMAVPLRQGEDILGILHVADTTRNRFGAADEAILRAVADQLTAAITASRLFAAEQRKTGRLEAVHSINREIAGVLDKVELVECVGRLVKERFALDAVSLYLVDQDIVRPVAGDVSQSAVRVGSRGIGQVAQTGQPLLIRSAKPFTSQSEDTPQAVKRIQAGPAQLMVPISVGARVFGVLVAGSNNPLAFDEADRLALGAVASQTAVALVNADNYADANQRAANLQALYAATQSIMGELSPSDVLQAVAERTAQLVNADRASVLLLSADGQERIIVAQSSPSPVSHIGFRLPVGQGIAGQVALTGTPILANDIQDNPNLLAVMRDTGLTAMISVPLQVKDRILGEVIATSYQSDFKFAERDMRLLRVFAQPAALAINNASLYNAERQLVEQLGLANRIGRLTTAALDVEDVLSIAVRSLTEDLGFTEAAILLADKDSGALALQAGSGEIVQAMSVGTRLNRDLGIVSHSFQTGEVVVANDVQHDPRLYRPTTAPLGSAVATPLRRGDEILGILYVGHVDAHHFSPAKVAVIQAIADQLAAALTAARLYEETLAAKQRAETILNEAQAGLVVLDEAWRIVALNPAAEAILQRSSPAVMGSPIAKLLGLNHAGALEEMATPTATASDGRRMVEAHLNEQKRDVLMGSTRLQPGFLVSLLDVTALKEVDRLKSEIVANFSHELRAPLASIKAYTELLLHYAQDGGELPDQFLTIVNQETDRLTELVNDVLDLSRLEAGRPEMEFSAVALLDLVEEVVRVLQVQAQERAIRMEVQASRPLQPVWGDRQLLGLLIRNLVVNAIKYNQPGGLVAINLDQIETGAVPQSYARLSVRDTGVGIPAGAMPHLFEKFFRVRSTTESGIQGTGLGLPLTKAAVEAHGGKISVTSQEGVGTEFTVLLPVAPAAASTHTLTVRPRSSRPNRKGKM